MQHNAGWANDEWLGMTRQTKIVVGLVVIRRAGCDKENWGICNAGFLDCW